MRHNTRAVMSTRSSVRLQDKQNAISSIQTSTSSSSTTSNIDDDAIILPPLINENLLPKSLPRTFTTIPNRQRVAEKLPTSDCLNFICRGRFLVLNRLKRLKLHKTDKDDRKSLHLLDNDLQ